MEGYYPVLQAHMVSPAILTRSEVLLALSVENSLERSRHRRHILWSGPIDVYWWRMLLGFVPSRSYFHTIDREPHMPYLDKLIKV